MYKNLKNFRISHHWLISIIIHIAVFLTLLVFSAASFKRYYPAKVHRVNLIKDIPRLKKTEPAEVKKAETKSVATKKETVKPAQKPEKKEIAKKNVYSAKKTDVKPIPEKERESLADKLRKELAAAEKKTPEAEKARASALIEPDNFPYTWYDGLIMNKISGRWEQPSAALFQKDSLFAVVSFKIMKDGTIAGLELKKKSGYPPLDKSVMDAVSGAAPFPPLPAEFAEGVRLVNVRFELTK
ncbi:MAG: TonB family protein [bacterium]|nr:TonB family protein [bacterium]